jgi:carbonic anhydrase
MHISAAQLALYRKRFADNARAVQPLNNRVVLESF